MFDSSPATIERDDFCSLAPIGWLHHKMQDGFFLVVGTHSCQGFLQTALGVMIFAKPRFATAVLDEDDLSGRDVLEAVQPLAEAVVAEHHPGAIFLGSTCTPEILKMNVAGCAKPLEAATGVRVYPCRLDGFDPAYTQGEDHVLQAMIERCPATDDNSIVILGCLSAIEEAEIRLECDAMGLPVPAFLPNESALDLPPIGPNTVLAAVHPYLFGSVSFALRERGCAIHQTIFPYGPDGTRAFFETLAAAFGKSVSYAERERAAWAACERDLAVLRGRFGEILSQARHVVRTDLGPLVFWIALLGLVLAWAYSAPPLRLKASNGWLANTTCAFAYEGCAWVAGAAAFGHVTSGTIMILRASPATGAWA